MHTEVEKMITSEMDSKVPQQEKSNDQNSVNGNDRQKSKTNKEYVNSSPRRNNNGHHMNNNRYNSRMSNNYGNRQNRNNAQQHRLDTNNNNNNNNNSHKMQHHQNNFNSQNGTYIGNAKVLSTATQSVQKSDYQEVMNNNSNSSIKQHNNNNNSNRPITKQRIVKASNNGTNSSYDEYTSKSQRADTQLSNGDKNISDDSGVNLNTSVSNTSNTTNNNTKSTETRPKYDHMAGGDNNESINRKYSMDFLHQVGHQYKSITANSIVASKAQQQQSQNNCTSPKIFDDSNLIAVKMALDNSGYYNHLYNNGMYTSPVMFHTQQQQQYQQNYAARYQQQQQQQQHIQQQQRMRMYPRQDNNNYQPRVYQQDLNRHQQPNSVDQRTYHNGYYQQQSYTFQNNSSNNTNNNNRAKNNQNRKTRSQTDRTYGSAKKNTEQNGRVVAHSKSDSSAHFGEENKRNKNLMYIQTNSEEYRSLSPTPPSSVKSSSPGMHDIKNCDTKDNLAVELFIDDSASTTSSIQSGLSYSSDTTKELRRTPTILLTPTENDVKEWINKNNFTPISSNGLSASAEQLNRTTETPVTVIKRPPSANGISSSTTPQHSHSIPKNYTLPTYDPTYPFDYYYARGERCEMREEPLNLSCGSIWDHVSHEIWNKFQLFQQTRETYRSKMILWRDLYEFIRGFPLFQQRACPKWGLFLVGSTISGFGLDTSDVDMCLVLKSAPQFDPRAEAMITLSALKNYLISSGSAFQGYYLINAKVPILRFRDATNTIEVDLNYNNCIGVRNTHLLYCYAQLDWRLRPLAIIVKLWAQYHNINDARNSTISSYSLVLMVIHFLQSAVSPPVLPCLHQKYPEKFQVLHDITTIDMMERLDTEYRSENYQSLGELFLRFLDYYSNFDYSRHAISIRTGGVLSIEECRNVKTPKNDPNHWQTLCIEEPFDLTNTARSTYDGEIFEKIKNVFFQSWRILREYKTLDSLFREPLFVQQSAIIQQQQQQQQQQLPIQNGINAQMLNDYKYYFYTPQTTLSTSPIITANQMNSEITS